MELGPQNHNGDGLLGLNSIIVVYMDPLGNPKLFEAPGPKPQPRNLTAGSLKLNLKTPKPKAQTSRPGP